MYLGWTTINQKEGENLTDSEMLNDVISADDTVSYGTLLDERTNAEINEQQSAVDNQYALAKE